MTFMEPFFNQNAKTMYEGSFGRQREQYCCVLLCFLSVACQGLTRIVERYRSKFFTNQKTLALTDLYAWNNAFQSSPGFKDIVQLYAVRYTGVVNWPHYTNMFSVQQQCLCVQDYSPRLGSDTYYWANWLLGDRQPPRSALPRFGYNSLLLSRPNA